MIKKDCFACRASGCEVLTKRACEKKVCSFYKTKEQFKADFLKSKARIDSLAKITQVHIREAYPMYVQMCKRVSQWR